MTDENDPRNPTLQPVDLDEGDFSYQNDSSLSAFSVSVASSLSGSSSSHTFAHPKFHNGKNNLYSSTHDHDHDHEYQDV